METPDLSNESFSSLRLFSFNADLFIEFDPRLVSMRFAQPTTTQGGPNSTFNLDSLLEKLPVFVDSPTSTLVSPSNRHQLRCCANVLNANAFLSAAAAAETPRPSMALRRPKAKDAFRRYVLLVLMKLSARVKRMRLLVWRGGAGPSGKAVRDEHGRGKRVFDVDIECSIDDAVLHCRSSCGELSGKLEV
ncbi:hypothetical protein M6B38_100205 [Iris pallida]|uniref:Uncharacterized protein n=1 Tax=Iris pallida TaxID=29817 RepID=A0AAX6ILT6_IRIPA|nr:hypothetical protein M6B38_100205 [Iris pallida]